MTPVLARRLGNDRAFERLYRKHAGDVYRCALVVLRNQADAEDVTQTTFLNAYRAFERGERPQKPQNWLIAIAHNVCRQRFRQAQRRPAEVGYEEELAESVVEEDALTAEDIRRALGHLAFNQRSALVMRELEGRSYQEIAQILGLSVSAVETLIFRARRALREQLEEGITCHEAEFAISRQLDGRLARKEKGALRGHLRECNECAAFARSQRAQRGALKALGAIPLPSSLAGLFGGSGATIGGGVAVKAAVLATGAMVATGVSYEGVKHGAFHARPAAAPAAVKKTHRTVAPAASHVAAAAAVIPAAQEPSRDQKPFRRAAVTARVQHRQHVQRVPAVVPPVVSEHKEVSPLPPSRERGHDQKPVHVKPEHVKPVKQHENQGQGHGQGQGQTKDKGKGNGNGATGPKGPTGPRGPTGEHGKSGH